jgi:hypothetical protein
VLVTEHQANRDVGHREPEPDSLLVLLLDVSQRLIGPCVSTGRVTVAPLRHTGQHLTIIRQRPVLAMPVSMSDVGRGMMVACRSGRVPHGSRQVVSPRRAFSNLRRRGL